MRARRIDGEHPRAACADALHLVDAAYRSSMAPEVAELKQLCRHCPIKQECGTAGMTHREEGVWGGMTPNVRTRRGGPPKVPNVTRRS